MIPSDDLWQRFQHPAHFSSLYWRPRMSLMPREDRVTEKSSNNGEFILVIISNTGHIYDPNIHTPLVEQFRTDNFLLKLHQEISSLDPTYRKKLLGDSFYQRARNRSSILVRSCLIRWRHLVWGRPLLLSLHRCTDLLQRLCNWGERGGALAFTYRNVSGVQVSRQARSPLRVGSGLKADARERLVLLHSMKQGV